MHGIMTTMPEKEMRMPTGQRARLSLHQTLAGDPPIGGPESRSVGVSAELPESHCPRQRLLAPQAVFAAPDWDAGSSGGEGALNGLILPLLRIPETERRQGREREIGLR